MANGLSKTKLLWISQHTHQRTRQKHLYSRFLSHTLTLINAGMGGAIILLHRRIGVSPQRNIRLIQDQSVNSSLSIVVQQKKTRVLYLSRFSRGGPTKFESTFFRIVKLRFLSIFVDFHQNSQIFKKILRGSV